MSSWKVDVLSQFFPPTIVQEILKVYISQWDKPDEVIWRPKRSGRFSVRHAYKLAISMSNFAGASLPPCPWSSIWWCRTLSKVQHFLWRCCLHAVPVRVALLDRGCVVSPLCPRCGLWEESVVHLIFSCPHSLQVWKLSPLRLDLSAHSFPCFWVASINRLVFKGFLWRPEIVVKKAVASFWEFHDAQSLHSSVQADSVINLVDLWRPPPSGTVKCNFDASFCRQSLQGVAEVLVCQRAVFCAMRLGFSCLWFESDALVVVNGGNRVAHALATLSRPGMVSDLFSSSLPPSVVPLAVADVVL
ncbi:uncharacterized protein LOC132314559 [Cornus florida]|uniref:uncharacterized protein LOC132314559 n=1 Tax=Cornus florida TaxID=4283 RepID=UPI0028967A06|nr:uncharacterized protein LOC132314559 [Cornus florida]